MHECRSILSSLHKVRIYRIAKESAYTSSNAEILDIERLALDGEAEQYILDSATEVLLILSKTEDSHDFRSRSDIKSALHHYAISFSSQSGNDASEVTVVDVEHSFPEHFAHCESVFTMLVDVIIQQSGNHIVCRSDGMEVASEVKVDSIHWQYLCISTTSSTTFHSETWSERRLAQRYNRIFTYLIES